MRRLAPIPLLLGLLVAFVGGCQVSPADEPDWASVRSFLYQLQRADPDRIGETAFDLVVVSLGAIGNSPAVIPALRESRAARRSCCVT
jgi:hypothetical protein